MLRAAVFAVAAFSTAAPAAPLTIGVGDSWAFSIANGQPLHAHRVSLRAQPARGEIKATVQSIAGTTMTLTNNSATSYTYRAQLLGTASKAGARTCTLQPNLQPSLEYWPQKAAAVVLSDFRPAKGAGNCPARP